MSKTKEKLQRALLSVHTENTYEPLLFKFDISFTKNDWDDLLKESSPVFIHDEIYSQIRELIVVRNPAKKLTADEKSVLVSEFLLDKNIDEIGTWAYYPWSRRVVHILDEDDFTELRTSRNRNKITKEEQAILKKKSIGIIGLSVGQSIALTIALERVCGKIRLADFDSVELSNMNRIRTGLHNIGINKAVVAAREIKEIDPFIEVEIYTDGLTSANMDDFFTRKNSIDLLVEVCDEIQVKINSRFRAKELGIPVVMDTNDRGMVDIERFDTEKNRPIFHGLMNDQNKSGGIVVNDLNRREILNSILSYDSLSDRMKASMKEIGKSITTWPQLASSVVLGGAATTDVTRRILLNQFTRSGRYYIDFDDIFRDTESNLQT